MAKVTLQLTGDDKENIKSVTATDSAGTGFRWGGENGHSFGDAATLATGACGVSFDTFDGFENDGTVDITGSTGVLTIENNSDDYDISYVQT